MKMLSARFAAPLRACALLLVALFAPGFAVAQTQWPTPSSPSLDAGGVVQMCLNSSGQAVPVSSGNCANGQQVTVLGGNPNGQTTLANSQPVAPASNWINDPCWATAAKISVPINQTANAQLVAGNAGVKTYVCSIAINSATAQSFALVEGTGTTCATGTAGVIGGTTAATGPSLPAAGNFTLGAGVGTVAIANAAAGDAVCLYQSGTGQISGVATAVQH